MLVFEIIRASLFRNPVASEVTSYFNQAYLSTTALHLTSRVVLYNAVQHNLCHVP